MGGAHIPGRRWWPGGGSWFLWTHGSCIAKYCPHGLSLWHRPFWWDPMRKRLANVTAHRELTVTKIVTASRDWAVIELWPSHDWAVIILKMPWLSCDLAVTELWPLLAVTEQWSLGPGAMTTVSSPWPFIFSWDVHVLPELFVETSVLGGLSPLSPVCGQFHPHIGPGILDTGFHRRHHTFCDQVSCLWGGPGWSVGCWRAVTWPRRISLIRLMKWPWWSRKLAILQHIWLW